MSTGNAGGTAGWPRCQEGCPWQVLWPPAPHEHGHPQTMLPAWLNGASCDSRGHFCLCPRLPLCRAGKLSEHLHNTTTAAHERPQPPGTNDFKDFVLEMRRTITDLRTQVAGSVPQRPVRSLAVQASPTVFPLPEPATGSAQWHLQLGRVALLLGFQCLGPTLRASSWLEWGGVPGAPRGPSPGAASQLQGEGVQGPRGYWHEQSH